MQSHNDGEWMDSLKRKAEKMREAGLSEITGGRPDEEELARWQYNGTHVIKRPDDEHGILRVSIGGGEHLDGDYCVFRGDAIKCRCLLQRAIEAMDFKVP